MNTAFLVILVVLSYMACIALGWFLKGCLMNREIYYAEKILDIGKGSIDRAIALHYQVHQKESTDV